jgi:transcriptional regulator with XRE-family HTH domain
MKKLENSECLNKDFGKFIKAAREKRDMYQSELAQIVGIRQSYISMIENGERNIDFFLALKLCQALNVDISDFISKQI